METVTRLKVVVKTQGRFRLLPKRPDTAKNGRKKVKDTFLSNYRRPKRQENGRKRIPQVWRIPQYRNSRLKLPKYRMKNWPIPKYRKPQCLPLLCSHDSYGDPLCGNSAINDLVLSCGSHQTVNKLINNCQTRNDNESRVFFIKHLQD